MATLLGTGKDLKDRTADQGVLFVAAERMRVAPDGIETVVLEKGVAKLLPSKYAKVLVEAGRGKIVAGKGEKKKNDSLGAAELEERVTELMKMNKGELEDLAIDGDLLDAAAIKGLNKEALATAIAKAEAEQE